MTEPRTNPVTRPDCSLPRTLGLRSKRDFEVVFQRSCTVANQDLVVYGCENRLAVTRIGLSVSRKVGNAVVRNRWKRRLREAFRLSRHEMPAGLDLVLIPRRGRNPNFDDLRSSLKKLAGQVARKLERDSRGKDT